MFVDLHLHADGIPDQDLATLAYFGVKAAVTCARDAGAGSAADLRRHWDELVRVQTARLRQAGIRPMVALALPPSRIPWQVAQGLGELGLQDGGEREEEILSRQLELAARLRKPVIVHTPDRKKAARTRRLLALLKESAVEPERVLVDHVNAETFALARGIGCWAGLTLQPGLFEAEAAAALISKHGADGIVLTSDIGEGPTDLLALPKAAEALKAAGLSDELRRRVFFEGPLAFLQA